MKNIFLFSLLTMLGCFANAQSKSPAIEAFEFLVDPSMSREQVSNAAYEVAEKYKLTLEEFLTIHEYGKGGNFDNFSSYGVLSDYSKEHPLSLDDLWRFVATVDAESKGATFWSLTRTDPSGVTSPIFFTGSDTEFVELLVKVTKKVSNKDMTEFLNSLFSKSSGQEFLKEMKFSASDLSTLLQASGKAKMSIYAAETLVATLGIKTLVEVQPELLFSKINFEDINQSSYDSQWEAVMTSYILAFTTDIKFLKSLKQSSKSISFPSDITQDVLAERFPLVSSLGESGEAEVTGAMLDIIDSAGYFEYTYSKGMYWADVVIKRVYKQASL